MVERRYKDMTSTIHVRVLVLGKVHEDLKAYAMKQSWEERFGLGGIIKIWNIVLKVEEVVGFRLAMAPCTSQMT